MSGFGDRLKGNTALRVLAVYLGASWVVLQVVDVVKDNMGLPDWVFPFAVVLLLIGLPVALIFAWAFELTPEGVIRTEAVPEDRSITSETGRKLDDLVWDLGEPGCGRVRALVGVAALLRVRLIAAHEPASPEASRRWTAAAPRSSSRSVRAPPDWVSFSSKT